MGLIILKIGGSAITDKNKEFCPRKKDIRRITREISDYLNVGNDNLIIVHGGGSYSHIVAQRYDLKEGVNARKTFGVSLTSWAARKLNDIVSEELFGYGVPAFPLQPSACFFVDKNGKEEFFGSPIVSLLKDKFVPVLYGDVVVSDGPQMFTIFSGERIILELSKLLNPNRVIFGTNVSGVFTENPQKNKDARLIKLIDNNNINNILDDLKSTASNDATGSMYHKVKFCYQIAELGVECKIINIHKENNLFNALMSEEVEATEVIYDK